MTFRVPGRRFYGLVCSICFCGDRGLNECRLKGIFYPTASNVLTKLHIPAVVPLLLFFSVNPVHNSTLVSFPRYKELTTRLSLLRPGVLSLLVR